MKVAIHKHTLQFKFKAGTSRGYLSDKDSWFVKIYDERDHGHFALGECGPLPGLSPEFNKDYENVLKVVCTDIENKLNAGIDPEELTEYYLPRDYPSIRFGMEIALADLKFSSARKIFDCDFYEWHQGIPINGLIWMGEKSFMMQQIKEKLEAGYNCIKIKVGALNFNDELELIKFIRKQFNENEVTIRLDANGAFSEKDALTKLKRLSEHGIHSIEQPIKQGQYEAMARLCENAPIDIALDEELIGIYNRSNAERMLRNIRPQYIIIKPTLLGGFNMSAMWISTAEKFNIGWWVTSLLESNIGLNAIAQFTSKYNIDKHHGLGTGQLYNNNIASPLKIVNGHLYYETEGAWDFSMLNDTPGKS